MSNRAEFLELENIKKNKYDKAKHSDNVVEVKESQYLCHWLLAAQAIFL